MIGAANGLLLIAPLGATAFLVFTVPNSPLAQPWSAMAGNAGSAFVAVSTLHLGFLAYVEQVLVPTLTPGDVVVLDAVTPSDARSFFTDCGCEPE